MKAKKSKWVIRCGCCVLFLFGFGLGNSYGQDGLIKSTGGYVEFYSDAPLEKIGARNNAIKGVILKTDNSFAFEVPILSFVGFNSPLQQEHFYENYMEAERFSKSTFTGTFIETIDFDQSGTHNLRAKGTLTIHGVSQPVLLEVMLVIDDSTIFGDCSFNVILKDYEIYIPRIVNKKIAEQIQVKAHVEFDR